jgi:hypothetical protein
MMVPKFRVFKPDEDVKVLERKIELIEKGDKGMVGGSLPMHGIAYPDHRMTTFLHGLNVTRKMCINL